MLRGLLAADLLGFQFFDHTRHFLTAVYRALGAGHYFKKGGVLFRLLTGCGEVVSSLVALSSHFH